MLLEPGQGQGIPAAELVPVKEHEVGWIVMPSEPRWYAEIPFSEPIPVALLRVKRDLIPSGKGVYVFANTRGRVDPESGRWHHLPGSTGGNLYVGITVAQTLRQRLRGYLRKRPHEVRINSSSLRHAGLAQLFVAFAQWHNLRGEEPADVAADEARFWLRWAVLKNPHRVEGALIDYLRPAFNTRQEKILLSPHDALGDQVLQSPSAL